MILTGFDIDSRSRDALDFAELLDWVAEYARTPPGATRVRDSSPTTDEGQLGADVETVAELTGYLRSEGMLLPGGLPSPATGLELLARSRGAIPAGELRALAFVVQAVGQLRVTLERLDAGDYPRLRGYGTSLPDLRSTVRVVLDSIAPDGTVEDQASAELRRIRRSRAQTTSRLTRQLEARLQRPDASVVIRDDFITQRNGRFVIPIRTDAPHAVQGIVHATSSSGATQFVEPLETVELNNELVRLAEREQQEIERVLLEWSEALRDRAEAVECAVSGLARLDALHARALFGRATDGTLATVERGGVLSFIDLRHPLLERRLGETGRHCVPLTIGLDPADTVLVLSGPNAGGKTVSLKTFGLAVLMAQSAVPLPAREVRLPLFRQLRADIGDHQSMQADLSTFSAHVDAVSRFVRDTEPPSLFLFDEIGTGTDPAEGAALARAVLEAMARPDVTVVATTHQSSLKAWAHTSERAVSAAMEFDTDRLRPTYRVLADAAGVSAGLDIAERVGLPGSIVARARELLGPEQAGAEDYLNRLQRQSRDLERRGEELARTTVQLEQDARRKSERLAVDLERERSRLRKEFDRVVARFEQTSHQELSKIADERQRARLTRRLARTSERTRGELAETIAAPESSAGSAAPIAPEEVVSGMRVWLPALGRVGVVDSVEGQRVRVLLGRLPTTVDRSGLCRPPPGASGETDRPRPAPPREADSTIGQTEQLESELMLLGKTVDEAESELDRFLDRAAVAGLGQVRVIHGHGTGRLKRAVREMLAGHTHVRHHRPGRGGEGGDGATVVTLR